MTQHDSRTDDRYYVSVTANEAALESGGRTSWADELTLAEARQAAAEARRLGWSPEVHRHDREADREHHERISACVAARAARRQAEHG